MTHFLIAPRVNSPWWPLALASALGNGRAPDTYPVAFHDWLLWLYAFARKGEGFQPAPAGLTLDRLEEAA